MNEFFNREKKVVFSGMQPSGSLTIGNYIGAIKKWVKMQDRYNCIYCIADQHAITKFNKKQISFKKHILDTLALYIACGINPKKSIIFVQSSVPQHFQLNWILSCCTKIGELKRMIQFKEGSLSHGNKTNVGILNYPILMASDILLYQTSLVPVGADQKQHIEICRKIASRFNRRYGDIFTIPFAMIDDVGSKIMGFRTPYKKMSKSDQDSNNIVRILDNSELIKRKIKSACTDSEDPPQILFNVEKKSGISNLINIFSSLTDLSISETENRFFGKNYSYFKSSICKILIEKLERIQKKFFYIRKQEKFLKKVLKEGSGHARIIAEKTMERVLSAIGLEKIF